MTFLFNIYGIFTKLVADINFDRKVFFSDWHKSIIVMIVPCARSFAALSLFGNARLRRGWSSVITGPRREKKASREREFIRFEK